MCSSVGIGDHTSCFFKILVALSYGGLESDVAFLCIQLHMLKNVVFVIAFDERTCKNSFDLLLRYILPVLTFDTEHRYFNKGFLLLFADRVKNRNVEGEK